MRICHFKPIVSIALVVVAILAALPFCLSPARAESNELARLLSGIEKKYANRDFTANFVQMSRLQALDITEKAAGTAYFSHPGKMHWAYQRPDVHQVITNGTTLWIYNPGDQQVVVGDARGLFESGAGGGFLSDIAMIKTEFDITLKELGPTFAWLDMTSRTDDPDVASVVLKINRASHEIHQVVSYNIYGDTTRFDFSNIRFGPVDASLFEFTPPAGTDIIQMNE